MFHVFLLHQVFEAASPVFLEIILLGSVFMYTSVSESKFLFSYSASRYRSPEVMANQFVPDYHLSPDWSSRKLDIKRIEGSNYQGKKIRR